MLSKLIRLGKDAELKYIQSGTAVLEITGVYDVGYGDNKKGQWIKLSMFGQRAEKLVGHFTKGTQLVIHADDIQARGWTNQSGEAQASLEGKLIEFQFAGGNSQGQQQAQAQQHPQQNAPQQPAPQMAPPQQAPVYQSQQPAPQPQGYGGAQQAPQQPPQADLNQPPF